MRSYPHSQLYRAKVGLVKCIIAKLIPFAILGLLVARNLLVVAVLLPLVYLGIRLGLVLVRVVNERTFNLVVYALLTLTAVQLLLGRSLISLLVRG